MPERDVSYRFGEFTLNIATRQLLLNDAEVHLSPKAFELLALLLANRSRAVPKAELQERLWPDTFVEETNLASLVAEIRRALHDRASQPLFVRTVYGFGYRFIGDVSTAKVEVRASPDRTRRFLVSDQREMMLMEGANVIGRAEDATIQIDSPGVSRYHARILVSDAGATLEDVNSKNGTFLNGKRLTTPVVLADGGEIRLGSVTLTFRVATPTSRTATMPASADS
jgi:DNA-binding winged helix-turn-helix (wHTH) protein